MTIIGYESGAFALLPRDRRGQRDVALQTVRQNGMALRFCSAELCADRDMVLDAVFQNGLALAYAAELLRADRCRA